MAGRSIRAVRLAGEKSGWRCAAWHRGRRGRKTCSSHGRTDGCTENFKLDGLVELGVELDVANVAMRCAGDLRERGGARQRRGAAVGKAPPSLKFKSPARVACRNSFKNVPSVGIPFSSDGERFGCGTIPPSDDFGQKWAQVFDARRFCRAVFSARVERRLVGPVTAGSHRRCAAVRREICRHRNQPRACRHGFWAEDLRARNFPKALRDVKCAKTSTAQLRRFLRRSPATLSTNGPGRKKAAEPGNIQAPFTQTKNSRHAEPEPRKSSRAAVISLPPSGRGLCHI